VFVFRKGSPLLEPFNAVIKQNRDLFQKINYRYLGLDYDEINERLCGRDKESERLPYFGLCVSLLAMCALGVLVLLLENIVYYLGNSATTTKALDSDVDYVDQMERQLATFALGPLRALRRRRARRRSSL